MGGRGEQGGVRAHGLAHQGEPLQAQRISHGDDVAHVGRAAQVCGAPSAGAVGALVERDDPAGPGQPLGDLRPLPRVPGQTMQEEEHGPGAAGIEDMQAGAVLPGDGARGPTAQT